MGGVLGYGPLADSNVAFACYAAVFLLSRLYLPVLLVFGGADAALAYSFLRDTVLGEKGLPLVLMVVSSTRSFLRQHVVATVLRFFVVFLYVFHGFRWALCALTLVLLIIVIGFGIAFVYFVRSWNSVCICSGW